MSEFAVIVADARACGRIYIADHEFGMILLSLLDARFHHVLLELVLKRDDSSLYMDASAMSSIVV